MQNNLRTLTLAASAAFATAALTSIPAMAATANAATVHVPFAFSVAGKTLPSGDYTVKRDPDNITRIQSSDASQRFAWVTVAAPQNDDRVALRFTGIGTIHVLESIQFGALTTPTLVTHAGKTEEISPEYAIAR